MMSFIRLPVAFIVLAYYLLSFPVLAQQHETIPPPRKLTTEQAAVAEANYQKYCSLCHGADRQGYVNDHAPSLRSKSLFESGVPHAILRPLSYGRKIRQWAAILMKWADQ